MKKIRKILRPYLPDWLILFSHKTRGVLAAYWYRFPSKKLVVVGVTGTNGKTTTCQMVASIFEEAGFSVGMATTLNFKIGKKEWENDTKMTTVSPFALQKLLREMVTAGCRYAIIETTSHAIAQFRNWGIRYNTVALTNITHDHYDYHKTYENYRDTKLKLFKAKHLNSVVNVDDKAGQLFLDQPAYLKLSYGLEKRADVTARKIMPEINGALFTLVTPQGQIAINLKIPGRFNIYNALAAASIGLSQKINLETIKKGLEKVTKVSGRLEEVALNQAPFKVIVDFAHTPDALQKVYEAIRPYCKGHLIAVLGATGERDKTKRPILGALAGRYADVVIVTNEDPYNENPKAIIDEVAGGVPRGETGKRKLVPSKAEGTENGKRPDTLPEGRGAPTVVSERKLFIIEDRAEAIKKALEMADFSDCVIITGKGGEHLMAVGDKKIPWDDIDVVKTEWKKIQKSQIKN